MQEEVVAEIEDIEREMKTLLKSMFEGQGKIDGNLTEVSEGVKPIKMSARKVPLAFKDKLEQELNRLQQLEIIKPVNTLLTGSRALLLHPSQMDGFD